MKRTLFFLLLAFALIVGSIPVSACGTEAHNFYCMHKKGHIQPSLGADIAFLEDFGGFYLDKTKSSNDTSGKVIYLTFDAGYENGNVEKILDVLKEENVKGAFFILSHLVEANTALVQRMFEEGQTVCNHTASHKDMTKLNEEQFMEELNRLERICMEKTGYSLAKYYRPPEGKFSEQNLSVASQNGYQTIFWSFAYADWDNQKQPDPKAAVEMILENLHNGEIMLLHPTSSTNAAILREVIQACKSQGYRFGTLDELTGGNRK